MGVSPQAEAGVAPAQEAGDTAAVLQKDTLVLHLLQQLRDVDIPDAHFTKEKTKSESTRGTFHVSPKDIWYSGIQIMGA